jgi:hypothetical protein
MSLETPISRLAGPRTATFAALLVFAAGCGGGSAANTAAGPSKARYEAAMRGYGAAAARATALLDRHPSHAQLLAALRAVEGARSGMLRLRAPAAVRAIHREYAAAFAYATGRLSAALRAELADDQRAARRIEREDLPPGVRSRFNHALLVFGERGYAIRPLAGR